MTTLVINVNTNLSANLFIELAKKLHFKARILSDEKKEDAGLLAVMEERKNDKPVPFSKIYGLLRKTK